MSDAINPDHYKRLPAEAIEIIEAAIDKAPSNQDALLHGQVLKYILRCWDKNGIEDLRKAKWYLDRLIDSFDESEQQPVIKQSSTTEPPDGWRWLEVGEVIRKGDTTNTIEPTPEHWVGTQCVVTHVALRRNKFEVGEKVVEFINNRIGVVRDIEAIGSGKACLYHVEMQDTKAMILFSPHQLAPYIEEQS